MKNVANNINVVSCTHIEVKRPVLFVSKEPLEWLENAVNVGLEYPYRVIRPVGSDL